MDAKTEDRSAGCPVNAGRRPRSNRDWWPSQLDVSILHRNSPKSDPMGRDFDYAAEFESLDLDAVMADLKALMAGETPAAG